MFGQSPSTTTWSLAKTAGVMLQNCRTGSTFAPSAGALPASWSARCCRMRLRVIGWLFSPASLSRNAGSAGLLCHHPDPSNASASTCVIRRDERLNVG